MNKITNPTRIMVFGTFEVLHKGHLNFFKQARALAKNPFLIVSVARDVNVKKIKGRLPQNREKIRFSAVKACPLVNKAVLGGVNSYLPHILKEKPQIIALGYDQTAYVGSLKSNLKEKGLIVKIFRLKPYKKTVYKSSLIIKGLNLKNVL